MRPTLNRGTLAARRLSALALFACTALAFPAAAVTPILATGPVTANVILVTDPQVVCFDAKMAMMFAGDLDVGSARVAITGQCGGGAWTFPAGKCAFDEFAYYRCEEPNLSAYLGPQGQACLSDAGFILACGQLVRVA